MAKSKWMDPASAGSVLLWRPKPQAADLPYPNVPVPKRARDIFGDFPAELLRHADLTWADIQNGIQDFLERHEATGCWQLLRRV
jgi:hypothetical protein